MTGKNEQANTFDPIWNRPFTNSEGALNITTKRKINLWACILSKITNIVTCLF